MGSTLPNRSELDLVCVAQVAAPHGVRGALRLRCFTEEPASVVAYGPLCDHAGRELFGLTLLGPAKGGVLARATGIDSREAAEALRGLLLFIPREHLPAPDEEEFYHADLIGLDAVGPDGGERGQVVAIHNFGPGDLIELRGPEGDSLILPFTREVVPEIDLAGGRIVVLPPSLS